MASIKISDDGFLIINGKQLNALVTSVYINNEVVWQEQTLLLESGNEKTFNGFEDAKIDLSVVILEQHDGGMGRFADLQILQSAFKAMKDKEAVIYQLLGDLFLACAIKEAVFSSMSVSTVDDSFEVSISLKEHNPTVSAVQQQQTNTQFSGANAEASFQPMSEEEERKLREFEESL